MGEGQDSGNGCLFVTWIKLSGAESILRSLDRTWQAYLPFSSVQELPDRHELPWSDFKQIMVLQKLVIQPLADQPAGLCGGYVLLTLDALNLPILVLFALHLCLRP
jgi:hypothetical protein